MAESILSVRALVEIVEQVGVSRGDFFAAARFDPLRLDEPDGRIEHDELDAIYALAIDVTRDEALGLHMGELLSATTFNLFAHVVAHAPKLQEGIDGLLRFQRLVVDEDAWRLEEAGDAAALVCDIRPGPERCRRFRAEVTLTGFHRLLRHFSPSGRPRCVTFDYPAPEYRREYTRVLGGLERFDEPVNSIVFDRDLLEVTRPHEDPEFHAVLQAQAEKRVSRLARTFTYTERVHEYLLGCVPSERQNMEAVARGLGLSARSLRRRLQEEGASYGELVERALATLAKRLIADKDRSIEAAAYEMGYSDATAFHRAFKRWTGSTPSAYRATRDSTPPRA